MRGDVLWGALAVAPPPLLRGATRSPHTQGVSPPSADLKPHLAQRVLSGLQAERWTPVPAPLWKVPGQNVGQKRAKAIVWQTEWQGTATQGTVGASPRVRLPALPLPHAGRRTARYLPAASPRSADGSPSRQRIKSAQDSRKNTAQGQKLGSESQHQLPGWFLSPLLPFPPTLPNRNSEKISVRGEKGRQELGEGFGVRPGCRHLLNLRSNLLAPVRSSVKQA